MAGEVITLRVPHETVEQIDALVRRRGESGSQVIRSAVESEIARDAEGRADALRRMQERLRIPLEAQAEFLQSYSISDAWRTF
jgi:Arc/MetJ-type ribon-helix-helix transcriptional regulator